MNDVKNHILTLVTPQMTFDPMIITWDMLGLIGDYCGKIQLNSDKVRQSYIIKTKMRLRYLINTLTPILTCYR